MFWLKIAFRNIWRNRMRSLICIMAIAGSVFLCVFNGNLAHGSYGQIIRNAVLSGSGHLAFYHRDYPDTREQEYSFAAGAIMDYLKNEPYFQEHLENICSRLNLPGLAKSPRNSEGIILMGVNLESERKTNLLFSDKFLRDGEWFDGKSERDAVMGFRLAEKLGLKKGAKFVVMVQGKTGEIESGLFYVRGLLRTGVGEIDGNAVITNLQNVQKLLGAEGHVHEVALLLKDAKQMEEAVKKAEKAINNLSSETVVLSWAEAMPQITNIIRFDRMNALIVAGFLFFIVALGVVNIFMMSVMDRVREFGILRAMGMTSRKVSVMVVSESFVLSLAGVLSGIVAALSLSLYTHHYGIDFSGMVKDDMDIGGVLIDLVVYTGWAWHDVVLFGFAMLFLCFVASLYPAILANRIKPAEAMRS